jgi:hypothetical protein
MFFTSIPTYEGENYAISEKNMLAAESVQVDLYLARLEKYRLHKFGSLRLESRMRNNAH